MRKRGHVPLPAMASMQRLQDAARDLHRIATVAELADALQESVATVGNWTQRGVSRAGALKAERHLGVSASWVLDGVGARLVVDAPVAEAQPGPDWVIRRLRSLLMAVPPQARDALGRQLQALVHAPDSAMLAEEVRKQLAACLASDVAPR